MPYQTGILAALRDHGLDARTVPGWETRGSSSFTPRGHVVHHDAIPTRWQTPPAILIAGRSDLPGPLCNFALNAWGTVYVVAAGRANHAGTGGWRGLSGNSSVWGTEAQNAGTGQTWPDEQIDAYVRLCAATCDYSGFSAEMVCRHAEWTTRKIDPAGPWEDGHDWSRDMSHYRALVARGGTGAEELTDQEWEKLGDWMQDQTRNVIAAVTAEVRADRRMTLDLVEAVSTEAGVDPIKVRARLKPETRAALDKVT